MRIEPFVMNAHMHILCKWLYLRDAYIPSKDEMPKVGFIAYSDNRPIAASFLRQMEGGHAQVDGMTSNPEESSELRHEALDKLTEYVVQAAKDLNISTLMAFTRDKHTLVRGVHHGFTHVPDLAVIAMRLKKGV